MPYTSPAALASVSFAPETGADAPAIERVLDRAFGPGRFAKPAERVRELARHNLALSHTAWRGGALIGCCRIYDISLGAAPALFLGPLAIDPDEQHHGFGHALVAATLEGCRATRVGAVVLMGEPSFFSVLGFARVPEGRVLMPAPAEPRRLQWIGLATEALSALAGRIGAPSPIDAGYEPGAMRVDASSPV